MSPGKMLTAGLIVAFIFSGCAKKPKQVGDSEFSRMPQASATDSAQKPAGDVFDEFYRDDNTAGAPSGKAESPGASFSPSATPSRPAVAKPSHSPGFTENGRYVVQISTVRSRTMADEIAAQVTAKGYPAYVADVENPTPALPGTYFRIRIGAFSLVSAARDFGENVLRPAGYDYWVDNKSNDHVGIDGYGMGASGGSSGYPSASSSTDASSQSWGSSATVPPEPAVTPAAVPETPAPAAVPETPAPKAEPVPATPKPTPAPASAAPAAVPASSSSGKDLSSDEWGDTTGW